MAEQKRSPLRLLAPLALICFTFAFLFIMVASIGSDDGEGGKRKQASGQQSRPRERASSRRPGNRDRLPSGVYVVKTGDTLGGIAQKTGLSVERLQELNPDLDPQTLVSGQRIKLRE